jgi:hypothetical protein
VTSQAGIAHTNHHRAVRFFWCLLVGASLVSLIGNIAHAVLPYVPHVVVQIGAATVPPIALLAAVHGIALAVGAGASGTAYRLAISATAAIGVGAFAVSFLALRDLMRAIGYTSTTAWIFPAIIDTAVAVSTMMLVALGDKPARRTRTTVAPGPAQNQTVHPLAQRPSQSAKGQLKSDATTNARSRTAGTRRIDDSASARPDPAQGSHYSAQAEGAPVDADFASELIATGATTQPVETVIQVLRASDGGASINAAANASGINYRTAQRIVHAAAERRQRPLVPLG